MKIGAVFPHQEIGDDPIVIRDWAQTAEALGYGHILAYDHVIGAVHEQREPKLWGPYTEQDDFHEPMVLFGYFAACTKQVELATGVLILPQRQTVLAAKQAAQIDLMSGGRLRLGVGTGWNYVEYDSLNEIYATRGARISEQVRLMRELWSQPVVDFAGDYHRVDRAGFQPMPKRSIPIWFGGFTPVAFRRAAKIGDGFIFGSGHDANLQAFDALLAELQANERVVGTVDSDGFGVEALMNFQDGQAHWRAQISDWQKRGASHVTMRAQALRGQGQGLNSPQAHIDALQTYWQEVGDLASA